MTLPNLPQWLVWARAMQAIAQSGLAYSANSYDQQRYRQLSELAGEIVATATGMPVDAIQQDFIAQVGYATPKIDVRGAVLEDGKILLVQERSDGRWCLPGGWADVGSSPTEMVTREVFEESGLEVVPAKLIGVFDGNRNQAPLSFFHAYKLIFLCAPVGGTVCASDETLDAAFFAFDQLPPLSFHRTSEAHLNEIQAHLHDPSRPTRFD